MIGWAVSGVLIVVAAFHLLWALGLWVPLGDEAALARAVFGVPGAARMPGPVPAALVAVAAFFLALLPHLAWVPFRQALLALAGLVLGARGLAAWTPAWRRHFPQQPFARLDRVFYGPLCLVLGAGLIFLATRGA
ncbi:MAG: DUF3995 domain-containing protein [Roseivivax sp.]|nr:DUF3995 domain-containing protein [Roseivivax sp.]